MAERSATKNYYYDLLPKDIFEMILMPMSKLELRQFAETSNRFRRDYYEKPNNEFWKRKLIYHTGYNDYSYMAAYFDITYDEYLAIDDTIIDLINKNSMISNSYNIIRNILLSNKTSDKINLDDLYIEKYNDLVREIFKRNDDEMIEYIISKINLSDYKFDGWNQIAVSATINNRKDILNRILGNNELSEDDINNIMINSLSNAIENQNMEMVDYFLEKDVVISPHEHLMDAYKLYLDKNDPTIYNKLVMSKNYDRISLLDYYQSQYPDRMGTSASEEEIYRFINHIMDKEGDILYKKEIIKQIIDGAVEYKSINFIKSLLELNNNKINQTTLHVSIFNDKYDMFEFLLNNGHNKEDQIQSMLNNLKDQPKFRKYYLKALDILENQ